MKFIIDRFEGEYVIIEDMESREMKEVMRATLPPSIHEGSVLIWDGENYQLDEDEESLRRKSIMERFQKLKASASD